MSTSSSKAEREKLQLIQEKSQQILSELLKDEDNKYCVDCDAKGPRWASWNLGVFLCIRCAGIHRNMGVHISKVKSVNLDSWSAEQVAYMQLMGNSKARAVYEANLPDNFKRPQADSGLEQFVRAKYEHKKYIAKEWVEPPTPKPAFDIEEERKKEKEKKRNKIIKTQTNSTIVEVQTNPVPRPHSSGAINTDKNGTNAIKLPSTDLLGLNTASSNQVASSVKSNTSSLNDDDQFDAFVSCAPVLATSTTTKKDNLVNINDTNKTTATKTNEEEDFFNQKVPEKKILDKESILKLYETSNNLNQAQSNLFNLNTQPLQPINNGSGFNTNPLLIPTNGTQIINPLQSNNQTNLFQSTTQPTVNGFANFNNQSANLNQQPFLAFNQTQNPVATNPFLTPTTNGTSSTDLFSSINTNLPATKNLETQLNGLNLNNTDTFNWPSTNGNTANISVGQSLFSANFDNLNTDKKLNGNTNLPATNNISSANPFNPFNSTIQPTIQQTTNNLDILSFNTTNGLNNKATNDLDNNWSNFSSATTTTNTLTADIWQ